MPTKFSTQEPRGCLGCLTTLCGVQRLPSEGRAARFLSNVPLSASIRLDASALVRDWLYSPSRPSCSVSVFKYDACAPVIGSSPETQSSGSFSVFDNGGGSTFGFSVVVMARPSCWFVPTNASRTTTFRSLEKSVTAGRGGLENSGRNVHLERVLV
jgi:hypothetical protein